MDARVAALETDVRDVKGVLTRMELVLARLDERVASSASRTDERIGALETRLDQRIGALETRLDERIGALETRLDERMANLATKADLAATTGALNTLTERVKASEQRTERLEKTVEGALTAAIGKAIGPWQLPGIMAACIAIVAGGPALLGWLRAQPGFFH